MALLTGIAQPGPLRAHLLAQGYQLAAEHAFADHHAFTLADLAAVRAGGLPGQVVFTTEKDAARLQAPALAAALADLPAYTISVRVALLAGGAARLAAAVAAATGPAGR